MNLEVLWTNFLAQIKEELSSLSYDTWFSETKLIYYKDGNAKVLVPMSIYKKHLQDNYYDLIKSIFDKIVNNDTNISFVTEDEVEEEKNEEKSVKVEDIPKDNNKFKFNSNLKKEYTFDNFVVGDSNKFAQSAAMSVAENPGKMFNPLFLFGNSGLGKTHLMHAIGNYIVEHSSKKVLYVTSEQFINDFVKMNRKSGKENNYEEMEFFKEKYRDIDVLMIDDIQYLGNATKSQQEFFHTFNTLFSDSKQIVVSSDRSPDDLKLMEDRLMTRFAWGLSVNIDPTDIELRKKILKRKIIAFKAPLDVPQDVIDYIAENAGSDVRHLEGAITRLFAYVAIMGADKITLPLALDALKDLMSNGTYEQNDIQRIQKIVAEEFQISVEDIRSKKRSANISNPRQIAMYLCRKCTNESFPKIGTEFGGKDHSTVMHSCDKIAKEIEVNKDLAKIIEKLKEKIGS